MTNALEPEKDSRGPSWQFFWPTPKWASTAGFWKPTSPTRATSRATCSTTSPSPCRERFPETIRNEHPLRREIIATQFTNKVVDLLGITFVHRSIRDTGASPVEVIRAALVALELLEVDPFIARVFALDNTVPAEAQYGALERLIASVEGIVHWILLSDLAAETRRRFC